MRSSQAIVKTGVMLLVMWPLVGLAEDGSLQGMPRSASATSLVFTTSEAAIQFALEDLQEIGQSPDPDNELYAKSLGFISAAEMASAQVGTGLRSYSVTFDQLKSFHASDDANNLLSDTNEIIVPFLVQGQARSSVTVAEQGPERGWVILKKGRSKLIRLIEQYKMSDKNDLIVIYHFGLRFLRDRSEGNLMLIPLQTNPATEMKAGQPILAQELFLRLSRETMAPRGNGIR